MLLDAYHFAFGAHRPARDRIIAQIRGEARRIELIGIAVSRSDRIAVGGRPRELARRGEHDRIRIGAVVARAARGVNPPPVMLEADTCEVAAEAAAGADRKKPRPKSST